MCITIFADQNELGAYFPLGYRNQTNCIVDGEATFYVRDMAHGAVVSEREMNGYDDSDFYATYYDAEKQEFKEICFRSTRGWTYPCNAHVDATPEILARWEQYNKTADAQRHAAAVEAEAKIPKVGRRVMVEARRGKAKAFNGQEGVIFWRQEQRSQYGTWSYGWRVGVRFNNGQRCFMPQTAVTVLKGE